MEEMRAYLECKGEFPLGDMDVEFNASEQAELQIIHRCFWLANWKGSKLKTLPPRFAGSALELWALIHMFVYEEMNCFLLKARKASPPPNNHNVINLYNNMEVFRELWSIDCFCTQITQLPIMAGIFDKICRQALPACDHEIARKFCKPGDDYAEIVSSLAPLMETYGRFPMHSQLLEHAKMTELELYAVDLAYRVIVWTQHVAEDAFMVPLPGGTDMEVSLVINMINHDVWLSLTSPRFTMLVLGAKALIQTHASQMNVSGRAWSRQINRAHIHACMNVSESSHQHFRDKFWKIREFVKASLKRKRNRSLAKILPPELMLRIADHISRSRYSDDRGITWQEKEAIYLPTSLIQNQAEFNWKS